MVQKEIMPENFNSPTFGEVQWDEALRRMIGFMENDSNSVYKVIVGTDSEVVGGSADFVSALIVHKKGKGGIYFWGRTKMENMYSMRQRIWQEAIISLALAEKLVGEFASIGLIDKNSKTNSNGLNLEIHVDVGPNGETRQMINEIVGMIRANGFEVATKPASWGASHVADRHV